MLVAADLQYITLSSSERQRAQEFATRAAMGGTSQVRSGADRHSTLLGDQLVGQLGEMALSKYLGGTPLFYELTRTIRNLDPTSGDDGEDLLATNVDVKCSRMRASPDPLRYRLLVRPRERHPGTVYLLALVGSDVLTTGSVCLVGWCTEQDLPATPEAGGPFAGAFVVPAVDLKPLPPIVFNWHWHYQGITCRTTG